MMRREIVWLLIFSSLYLCPFFLSSQTIYVQDSENFPLESVSVYNEELNYFSETDEKGTVQLPSFDQQATLTFSILGYKKQSHTIAWLKENPLVKMDALVANLELATVVGRRDETKEKLPYLVHEVKRAEIEQRQSQTSAELLEKSGLVYVQKSQMGGGSPVLRGFEANRILLVVDGVRMNNAIYRSGHLQNAITVDQGVLEQAEIIFGPGSLTYGSDALGGVIHYRTREPEIGNMNPISLNFYTRYATANQEKSAHIDLSWGKGKWGFLSSATISDYGDLRSGNRRDADFPDFGKRPFYIQTMSGRDTIVENTDPNIQVGTAYRQIDFLQKLRFKPSNSLDFVLNVQYSNSSDIPRYDRLIETRNGQLRFAEWYYGPQERLLTSLKTRLLKSNVLFDRANVIASFQAIGEDRHDRKFLDPWRENSIVDVKVYSLSLDFDKYLGSEWQKLSYGIEINHNDVVSRAFRENINSLQRIYDINPRYPSGENYLTQAGLYLNYEWQQRDSSLLVNAGLRYTNNQLFTQFTNDGPIVWPEFYTDGLSSSNRALTWAIGGKYRPHPAWELRAFAGSAFRAPNIDDYSKIRENNGFVTIPNPGLEPERTNNIEVGLQHTVQLGSNQLWWGINGFHTWLNNAIVRTDFSLPDGRTFFLSRGDSLNVQSNINANRARIMGISGQLKLDIGQKIQFNSSITFTKGERKLLIDDDPNTDEPYHIYVPLDHIPPTYGQASLVYTGKKFRMDLVFKFNGAKRFEDYAVSTYSFNEKNELILYKEGTSDNIELARVVTANVNKNVIFLGSGQWQTINIYSSLKMNEIFSLNLALENLFDIHYRPFASGVSAPGRNFIVALRGKI